MAAFGIRVIYCILQIIYCGQIFLCFYSFFYGYLKFTMKHLALDLGTSTGWAVHIDGQKKLFSGVVSFKTNRFSGGGVRFLKFKKWLDIIDSEYGGFDQVEFEEVRRHLGVDAAHIYGGFLAVLSGWCEDKGVAYQGYPVGTIKKHATGKGNANKDDVIKSIKQKGYQPTTSDEADAIAVMLLALDDAKNI